MAKGVVRVEQPSRVVRAVAAALRRRHDALVVGTASNAEWRRLQYESVRALVDAQRAFVELHAEILSALRRDKPLYTRLRLESLELSCELDALRELIGAIERALTLSES